MNRTLGSSRRTTRYGRLLLALALLAPIFGLTSPPPASSAIAPTWYDSCAAIRAADPSSTDGSYQIVTQGRIVPVYCADMSTDEPKAYIELLHQGDGVNYSEYRAGGHRPGTDVVTLFKRVRLNEAQLLIYKYDDSYADPENATSTGMVENTTRLGFGIAANCNWVNPGTANINLTGTPYTVIDGQFTPQGWEQYGDYSIEADGQIVNLTGGGQCGSVESTSKYIRLSLLPITVSGVLQDENGDPLEGVNLSAAGGTSVSQADGSFDIAGTTFNRPVLGWIDGQGFGFFPPPAQTDVSVGTLTVILGETADADSGAIAGLIQTAAPEAYYAEAVNADQTVIRTAMLEASGEFSIGQLPPGSYTLRIRHASTHDVRFTRPNISVAAGSVSNVEASLSNSYDAAHGGIIGKVLDTPYEQYAIEAQNADGAVWRFDVNEDSTYAIGGLSPGTYTVRAVNKLDGNTLNLHFVEVRPNLSFYAALFPDSESTGVIRGDAELINPDWTELVISVEKQDFNRSIRTASSLAGYAFAGLEPAAYTLTAEYAGMTQQRQSVQVTNGVTKTEHFRFGLASVPGKFNLSGTIMSTSDTIPGYVTLMQNAAGINTWRTPIDSDGTFNLYGLEPGSYEFTIRNTASQALYMIQSLTGTAGDTTIDYTFNGSPVANTATISGVVRDTAGNPLPGASITLQRLYDPNPHTGFYDTLYGAADGSGGFAWYGVTPGIYALAAKHNLANGTSHVIVTSTEPITRDVIVTAPGFQASGWVTDGSGANIYGAIVRLFDASTDNTLSETRTSITGYYALKDLAPGSYRIEVTYGSIVRHASFTIANSNIQQDFSFTNSAPVASVNVTGTASVGTQLTAVMQYADEDGDEADTPIYQWQRSYNPDGPYADIHGADSDSYTVQPDDIRQFIRIALTPTAQTGVSPGNTAYSAPLWVDDYSALTVTGPSDPIAYGGTFSLTLSDARDYNGNLITGSHAVTVRVGSFSPVTLPAVMFDASGTANLDGLIANTYGSNVPVEAAVAGLTSAYGTHVDIWPPPTSGAIPLGAAFTDTDPREGTISGRLFWTGAEDETYVAGYDVLMMNGTSVAAVVYTADRTNDGSYYYDFNNYAMEDASGIGIFARGLNERYPAGLILHDVDFFIPPASGGPLLPVPDQAGFTDVNGAAGIVSGHLTWEVNGDETNVTGYELYAMNGNSPLGSRIAFVEKNALKSYSYTFNSFELPAGADGFGIYARSTDVIAAEGKRVAIVDYVAAPEPGPVLPTARSVSFLDTDARVSYITGKLSWTPADDETGISGYAVYFVNGIGERLEDELGRFAAGAGSYVMRVNQALPSGAVGLAVFSVKEDDSVSSASTAAYSIDQTSVEGIKAALRHALFPSQVSIDVRDIVQVLARREDITGDGVYGREDARLVLSLLG